MRQPDPRNVRDHLFEAGYTPAEVERMIRAGSPQGRQDERNRRIALGALMRILAVELGPCERCGGDGGPELVTGEEEDTSCFDCGGSGMNFVFPEEEAENALDEIKGSHITLRDRGGGERPVRPECPICGRTDGHAHAM